MGQFHANIFLIPTTSNYWWTSEVFKNLSFKSQLFWSSQRKSTHIWNTGIPFMPVLFFINKVRNLCQFLGKKNPCGYEEKTLGFKGEWEDDNNWLLKLWFLKTSQAHVVGSGWYQKNIGVELTHWYVPSLC